VKASGKDQVVGSWYNFKELRLFTVNPFHEKVRGAVSEVESGQED